MPFRTLPLKTHTQLIADSLNFKTSQHWSRQHANDWHRGGSVPTMLRAAAAYADSHFRRYESGIGEDGVLGLGWVAILQGCRTLLNGDIGGLDGGTVDSLICAMLVNEGFDPDNLP